MSYLLVSLLTLAALLLAYLFIWAFWQANHLDDNTLFHAWVRCYFWRGQHRPIRHPLGGFRCLDCLETTRDLVEPEWTMNGGYVNPDRHTYTSRRGA